MSASSARALRLLSLLTSRSSWPGPALATRLEVSTRTLRRDVDALRTLGYPVEAVSGPEGGYRLGSGGRLPPLLLDDDQALAIAVALQTAPRTVSGIDESLARALSSIEQVMTPAVRSESEAARVTSVWNPWEFLGPPVDAVTLRCAGAAVRRRHLLRFELLAPDGRRPHPADDDFEPPRTVEPHRIVVRAGRWYVVGFEPITGRWRADRLDLLHLHPATDRAFEPRPLPPEDVVDLVRGQPRAEPPEPWPCLGEATMALPARTVAPWLPGGAVVAPLGRDHCRVTLGAWSWPGVAGLLATFGTALKDVEPRELRAACARMSRTFARAAGGTDDAQTSG